MTQIVGWREHVRVLGLELEAKLDTGARSSALHAADIVPVERDGPHVSFRVPKTWDGQGGIRVEAPLLGHRWVRDSGAHGTLRPVIEVEVVLGGSRWTMETTLADRTGMACRMLLGRPALKGRCVVDAQRVHVLAGRAVPAP